MLRLKRSVILVIGLILLSGLVMATDKDDYKPGWFESWDEAQTGVLSNFWHSLNPYASNNLTMEDDADIYNWYNGTFFGLANWEREVCLLDLATDVRNVRGSGSVDDRMDIYTTTLTVSALRTLYWNTSYYEASWYIMPYTADMEYKVYLTDGGDDKEYLAGKAGDDTESFLEAIKQVGDSGYEAIYLTKDYKKVVLEYRMIGSTDPSLIMENEIGLRNETG